MFEASLSFISAVLLLSLSAYTISKQRNITSGALSLAALLLALIEIFDQLSIFSSSEAIAFRKISMYIESLLPVTFLFFSLKYSRHKSPYSVSPFYLGLLAISIIFPAGFFLFSTEDFIFSPDLQSEKILFLGKIGYWFYIGILLYCVAALMNIEATFSSTTGSDRGRIKFEAIGIVSILAMLILYYSQGLLYRTINMNLLPVRSSVFIVSTLFIGYSKLMRGNGIKVVLSRNILYKSLTLFSVGLYLILLGLTGEGMRYLETPLDKALVIFSAFAIGIVILILLLSETIRRKVKVFVNKHFYAHKHAYRDEWLKFTGRLASCKTLTDVYEAMLTTYKETFGLQSASLYISTAAGNKYVPASHPSMNTAMKEFQASPELISYFIDQDRVLNPSDNEYRPAPDEASFLQQSGLRLIVPLICNQRVEGLIVFGKQIVNEEFIYEDYDLMKILARQAAISIANFRLTEELIDSREVASIGRISSFVIHDLKNLTYTLSLIVDNAEEHIANPNFQKDMMGTIKNTLSKMKGLIQKLKSIPEKNELKTETKDIYILCKETIDEEIKTRPDYANIVHGGIAAVCRVDEEEIKKVIINLVQNAFDAGGEKGLIRVATGANGANAYIQISDEGCGMTEDFINNHLFRPFRTTKKKGLGIGLYQCKQIVEAHAGRIEVNSTVGKGTVFTVYLPIVETAI